VSNSVARRKKRQRSFGEYYISQFLDYNKINYNREKTFPNCVNSKNNKLRFDFFLTDYNILIEFQGKHHYKPVNKYNRAKTVHKKTVLHDHIKRQYCKNNNIILIEINYLDINNIFDILIEELDAIIGE